MEERIRAMSNDYYATSNSVGRINSRLN